MTAPLSAQQLNGRSFAPVQREDQVAVPRSALQSILEALSAATDANVAVMETCALVAGRDSLPAGVVFAIKAAASQQEDPVSDAHQLVRQLLATA